MRRHLTIANAISLVAVFIALGGTALASVIITKNSQVDRGTISGHNPPSDKHSNIISGSINGGDLQNLVFHKANLQNGWTSAGRTPVYTKDAFGIVHLFGNVVHSGPSSSEIFRLPAGYRPSSFVDVPVALAAPDDLGVLDIEGSGSIFPPSPPTTYVDLEGISFRQDG